MLHPCCSSGYRRRFRATASARYNQATVPTKEEILHRPSHGSTGKEARVSSIARINVATYGLSGLFAAGAAFSCTESARGSPTIGKGILPSVTAAAVVGGVSRFLRQRGHLCRLLLISARFILALVGKIWSCSLLKVSSYWQAGRVGCRRLHSAVLAQRRSLERPQGRARRWMRSLPCNRLHPPARLCRSPWWCRSCFTR